MNFNRRADDIPPSRRGWRNLFRIALIAAVSAAWAWGASYCESDDDEGTDEHISRTMCAKAADTNECIFGEPREQSTLLQWFEDNQPTYEF